LSRYRFQLGGEEEMLALEPRSILNWSNAERATEKGGVFLWTYQGRPQLIACAYIHQDKVQHEFQSLATLPITCVRDARQAHRFDPGIEWKPLKDAPVPTDKPALRLSQFRRQAERFTVTFGTKDKWDPARLLKQPVFLAADKSVALFLFVQGTDPECALLLAIEDEKTWQYALARQTRWGLKAHLEEVEVWEQSPAFARKFKVDAAFVVLAE
jgi:hypothetical protein